MTRQSCIYTGRVEHRRYAPVGNTFSVLTLKVSGIPMLKKNMKGMPSSRIPAPHQRLLAVAAEALRRGYHIM